MQLFSSCMNPSSSQNTQTEAQPAAQGGILGALQNFFAPQPPVIPEDAPPTLKRVPAVSKSLNSITSLNDPLVNHKPHKARAQSCNADFRSMRNSTLS